MSKTMKPIDIPVTGNTIIRIQETEYEQRHYVDVRKFYKKEGDDEWKPTNKGISLDPNMVEKVAQALLVFNNNKTHIRQEKTLVPADDKYYVVARRTPEGYRVLHEFENIKEALKHECLPNHIILYVKEGKYLLRAKYNKETRIWDREVEKTKTVKVLQED